MVLHHIPDAYLLQFGQEILLLQNPFLTDGWMDRRTDEHTNGETDTHIYKDARTHLRLG